jgi:DNA (cytosine-5)-methyltransferase 1
MEKIRVIELFAGVGGFRLGLEKASKSFEIVWSNQWEPSTKTQAASEIYVKNFGEKGHSNENISLVETKNIPEHDLLVGGFPCQDYSVARTLNQSAGLEGKKGVLWWDIHRILSKKKNPVKYLFLENVDRLLKSPVKQRGRDFAIMLASLSDLGYFIEWRIINAADYGMPQRRKRIFILAYHKTTSIYKKIKFLKNPFDWVLEDGVLGECLEVVKSPKNRESIFTIDGDLPSISSNFNNDKTAISPFYNSGIVINRKVFTVETKANYDGNSTFLGDIILPENEISKEFFIDKEQEEKWEYFKKGKSEKRINKATGFEYNYSEGGMAFPDPLNKPSRTIITGEGGASASRFKHVIRTLKGNLRRLTPIELERLNMFPDNHTEGASDIKRAFFMGNALVVGVIEKIGRVLVKKIEE